VIAQSYERIHRSNLAMMGVLPLQFEQGQSAESLGLTGEEVISVYVDENVKPRDTIEAKALNQEGKEITFKVIVRFDSEVEIDYYRNGGILQTVLRRKLAE
jgi:aconitate hydratase